MAYYSEEKKRSKLPLNEIEIATIAYSIKSISKYQWRSELHLNGLILEYFFNNKGDKRNQEKI